MICPFSGMLFLFSPAGCNSLWSIIWTQTHSKPPESTLPLLVLSGFGHPNFNLTKASGMFPLHSIFSLCLFHTSLIFLRKRAFFLVITRNFGGDILNFPFLGKFWLVYSTSHGSLNINHKLVHLFLFFEIIIYLHLFYVPFLPSKPSYVPTTTTTCSLSSSWPLFI